MSGHEYILENYLVNYVFKNLFPVVGDDIFDNYVILITHYAMIKMMLIGMAGYRKENFGIDYAVKLIQSFSRAVEHDKNYVKRIFELLKENKMDTLGYMAILVKD